MRFLIGLIVGTAVAISVSPVTRERLLETVVEFVGQMQLSEIVDPVADMVIPEQPGEVVIAAESLDSESAAPVNPPSLSNPTGPADPPGELDDTSMMPAEQSTSAVRIGDARPSLFPMSLVQAAWSPFYSETSARGFAARLTRHLALEFYVIKNGPASYDVVFDYSSEAERQDILESVQSVTGFDPQRASMAREVSPQLPHEVPIEDARHL